jgi:hypothetical protein
MFRFTRDFNCCKTVHCKNFALANSDDYIAQSWRLGYLSIHCKECGSSPPWVDNVLVEQLLNEQLAIHFSRELTDCSNCGGYFFFNKPSLTTLSGYTSSGRQRKKCIACERVFTLPYFKNSGALKQVLSALIAHQEIGESVKSTGLSARLYYFYLEKLAQLLTTFSRLNEEKVMGRDHLALYTHGKVIKLAHKRGFYTLLTSEGESGYILQQTNNLTKTAVDSDDIYRSKANTIIDVENEADLDTLLIKRYEQNLNRKHFEQLLVGELKPLAQSTLIAPDKVAYVHFQLLMGFTSQSRSYTHFIEHESCLRSAALMASSDEIKKATAEVCFFVASPKAEHHLDGKKIGWWEDKWFSDDSGAYCPASNGAKFVANNQLKDRESIDQFYLYLDQNMHKGINSCAVVNQLSAIHRVLFNYCQVDKAISRAQRLGVCDIHYTPQLLLDAALKAVMNDGY